jgi:predicted phosphodiesterase
MRYLVLTDIHANLEALESCLADAAGRHSDTTLILGDLIGYGADPNAVVERVRQMNAGAMVRGNHDKVAIGIEHAEGFNAVARAAAIWTLDELTPENRAWVAALPQGPATVDDFVEICHGAPFDEDVYLFTERDALEGLTVSNRQLCLFGHTHYPITFRLTDGVVDSLGPARQAEAQIRILDGVKYLLNPGSVGQPRDGDPRAAYAIVDTAERKVELYRVDYPIQEAQRKIVDAGLPEPLAWRLTAGR